MLRILPGGGWSTTPINSSLFLSLYQPLIIYIQEHIYQPSLTCQDCFEVTSATLFIVAVESIYDSVRTPEGCQLHEEDLHTTTTATHKLEGMKIGENSQTKNYTMSLFRYRLK